MQYAKVHSDTPMPNREDRLKRLLLRIADGDAASMQELFLQERAALHRLFLGLGRCPNRADDLVQNTFLGLWRYRTNYKAKGSASGYVYRVAVHQWRKAMAKDLRRKDTVGPITEDLEEPAMVGDASSTILSVEAVKTIWEAVRKLPDLQREVFLLHRHHGLSCPEIAAATDTNLRTVESRLRLALKKLAERLQPMKESG